MTNQASATPDKADRSPVSSLMRHRAMKQASDKRLQPPPGLSKALRDVWVQTTSALPPEWFASEQAPVLELYCRHVVRAAQIEAALVDVDPVADLATFDRLVKLAGLESSKIAMHARAMRLTQQSRLKAETASNRSAAAAEIRRDSPFDGDDDELLARPM